MINKRKVIDVWKERAAWLLCIHYSFQVSILFTLNVLMEISKMVTVKYDVDSDGISMSKIPQDDDLIERNFHSRFWLRSRKFQGTISQDSWLRKKLMWHKLCDIAYVVWYSFDYQISERGIFICIFEHYHCIGCSIFGKTKNESYTNRSWEVP